MPLKTPARGGATARSARSGHATRAWPALLGALAPAAALAQAVVPTAAPTESPAQQLAPMVVTGTRVQARAFDVPASIDRVDGEAVRDGHAQVNISESLGGVAGLIARDRQNYAQDVQISVRGFGARSSFGIRGVRLYVDGIPATFPDGQGQITNVDLGTVQSIEVLRGPSSALYGNSSGGVLQVFTQDGSGTPSVDFSLGGGSNGVQREALQARGSSGNLGYVLGASHFRTDGYRDHSAAERNIGNAKLNYSPDDATHVTFIVNAVSLPEAQDPLGLTRALYDANPRGVDSAALLFNTRKTIEQQQGGLIWEHQIDPSNALRALFYLGHRGTEQFQAIPVASQVNPLNPGGVIQLGSDYQGTDLRWTLRSALADRPFTLVAGVSIDSLGQSRQGYQNFTGAGANQVTGVQGALRRDELDTALDEDVYVQGTWQLARDWSASVGWRHSSVRIESIDHYIVGANGDDSGASRYGSNLPVFGAMYALNDQVHFYASAGRGFETPTLNELAYRPDGSPGLNFALQPASSRNVELGVKARPAGLGEWSAAIYDTQTDHEIVVVTNSGGRSTYQNAGTTQRTGLELSWNQTFAAQWHAQAALTSQTAVYHDGFQTCPPATPTCTKHTQAVPAGSRIPGVPRNSLFGAIDWTPESGWRAGVEARYVSAVYVNDSNTDAAPHYVVASAHMGYVAQIGAWQLTSFARVDNLFDRRYAGSVIVNEGNGRYFEPAPGRTAFAGVNASYSFAAL